MEHEVVCTPRCFSLQLFQLKHLEQIWWNNTNPLGSKPFTEHIKTSLEATSYHVDLCYLLIEVVTVRGIFMSCANTTGLNALDNKMEIIVVTASSPWLCFIHSSTLAINSTNSGAESVSISFVSLIVVNIVQHCALSCTLSHRVVCCKFKARKSSCN